MAQKLFNTQLYRPKDFKGLKRDAFDKEKLADELADVLIYSFTLADTVGLDIEDIILSKIKKNAKKYPLIDKK